MLFLVQWGGRARRVVFKSWWVGTRGGRPPRCACFRRVGGVGGGGRLGGGVGPPGRGGPCGPGDEGRAVPVWSGASEMTPRRADRAPGRCRAGGGLLGGKDPPAAFRPSQVVERVSPKIGR